MTLSDTIGRLQCGESWAVCLEPVYFWNEFVARDIHHFLDVQETLYRTVLDESVWGGHGCRGCIICTTPERGQRVVKSASPGPARRLGPTRNLLAKLWFVLSESQARMYHQSAMPRLRR